MGFMPPDPASDAVNGASELRTFWRRIARALDRLVVSRGRRAVPAIVLRGSKHDFRQASATRRDQRQAIRRSMEIDAFQSTTLVIEPPRGTSLNNAAKAAEPSSCLWPSIFMIGRDSRGNWVAQEQGGARGGLFVDPAGALKFAKSENGNHPHAVVWVSGVLELDASRAPATASAQRPDGDVHRARRVA